MKQSVLKSLLIPFGGLYGLLGHVRNLLFDKTLFAVLYPNVFTISVGNLAVGGTGKTPMVELLIQWYTAYQSATRYETATLSRGYGRQTKGFRIATPGDTAATLGDEPMQLYRKFGHWVRVCVGERRADAILTLLQQHPETKLVLLDDAFQHRAVAPSLNILLMDYNRPFYDDYPFPAGRLRESRYGARRAQAVVVTKCPAALTHPEQQRIEARIRPYCQPETPLFFASLRYGQPVSFAGETSQKKLTKVVLVSGLANADPLEKYVREVYTLEGHYRFADHFSYSRTHLNRLVSSLPPGVALLTTEKDWVKLDALLTTDERAQWPLYYLPVETALLPGHDTAFLTFLNGAFLKNG